MGWWFLRWVNIVLWTEVLFYNWLLHTAWTHLIFSTSHLTQLTHSCPFNPPLDSFVSTAKGTRIIEVSEQCFDGNYAEFVAISIDISTSHTHLLFFAMPTPKQDLFRPNQPPSRLVSDNSERCGEIQGEFTLFCQQKIWFSCVHLMFLCMPCTHLTFYHAHIQTGPLPAQSILFPLR